MQTARMIGNYIQKLVDDNNTNLQSLGDFLGCSCAQMDSLIKGRSFISFPQLEKIAAFFHCSVSDILSGDEKNYTQSVVHCMNDFSEGANREKVLDLIDDYMDVVDSLI